MASPDAAPGAPRTRTRPVDPRLLRYARASRGFFAITGVTVLVQTAVIAGFAWLLTSAIVGAVAGRPVADLLPLVAGAAGLVVLRAGLVAVSERTSAVGAARASLQLRAGLVAAIERLGPAWLANRNATSLAVTAGHGLEALDAYFGRYLPQLVATAITMPILVLVILVADPISGITVILTIPLIPLFMVLIGLATRTVQRSQYGTLHRLATRFADTVGGLGTLKIFGRDRRAADSIERVTRRYKRETMAVLRVSFLSGFALEFLASISVAIIAVTIGLRLLAGELDLLTGLFVLLIAPEAYLPLRQVGVQFHAAAEGVAATDEIFEVLDAATASPPPETSRKQSPRPVLDGSASGAGVSAPPSPVRTSRNGPSGPILDGSASGAERAEPLVEARRIRVRRGDGMLPPVDLVVRAGEVVLLEGPSGVGKSSVLAALLGFASYEGALLVRGADAPDARATLAWAGQRPGLVSGTVRENVALGHEAPDDALVLRCLGDVGATPEVAPGRELGVQGAGLSGGQAQRVAIARALYRLRTTDAAVLALDEPTSALDPDTEARVWAAVRAEADAGAGVILVSHRTSARAIADHVVRLEPAGVTA